MRGPRPSGPARRTGASSGGRMSGRACGGRRPAPPAWPSSGLASAAAPASASAPAGAFAPGFASASVSGVASAASPASALAPAGAFAPDFASAAFASLALPFASAPLPNARAASSSSTLEAATFTSRPALRRTSRASLLEIPRSFAISWTRFLAIGELSLWSPVALLPAPERPARALCPQRGYRRTRDGRTRRRPSPLPPRRDPPGSRHRRRPVAAARPSGASGGSRHSGAVDLRLLFLQLRFRGRFGDGLRIRSGLPFGGGLVFHVGLVLGGGLLLRGRLLHLFGRLLVEHLLLGR